MIERVYSSDLTSDLTKSQKFETIEIDNVNACDVEKYLNIKKIDAGIIPFNKTPIASNEGFWKNNMSNNQLLGIKSKDLMKTEHLPDSLADQVKKIMSISQFPLPLDDENSFSKVNEDIKYPSPTPSDENSNTNYTDNYQIKCSNTRTPLSLSQTALTTTACEKQVSSLDTNKNLFDTKHSRTATDFEPYSLTPPDKKEDDVSVINYICEGHIDHNATSLSHVQLSPITSDGSKVINSDNNDNCKIPHSITTPLVFTQSDPGPTDEMNKKDLNKSINDCMLSQSISTTPIIHEENEDVKPFEPTRLSFCSSDSSVYVVKEDFGTTENSHDKENDSCIIEPDFSERRNLCSTRESVKVKPLTPRQINLTQSENSFKTTSNNSRSSVIYKGNKSVIKKKLLTPKKLNAEALDYSASTMSKKIKKC